MKKTAIIMAVVLILSIISVPMCAGMNAPYFEVTGYEFNETFWGADLAFYNCPPECVVVMAVYVTDTGELFKMKIFETEIYGDIWYDFFNMDKLFTNGVTFKIFLWDRFYNMRPLCDSDVKVIPKKPANYGVVMGYERLTGFDDCYELSLLTNNGEIETYRTTSTLGVFNGYRSRTYRMNVGGSSGGGFIGSEGIFPTGNLFADTIPWTDAQQDGWVIHNNSVITFKPNINGNINMIYLAPPKWGKPGCNYFNCYMEGEYGEYKHDVNTVTVGNRSAIINSDTKIFVVPDKDNCFVMNPSVLDGDYIFHNVKVYDVDVNGYAGLVVVEHLNVTP